MRKLISAAGMVLFVALLLVQPAKADNFDTFTFTSGGTNITFTLPATLTPAAVGFGGLVDIFNVSATYDGKSYTFNTVQIGPLGTLGATNYSATGSMTKFVAFVAPGLYTMNSNGTITINPGVYHLSSGTLTIVDPPGDPVGTPEPASLILLGFGGLALGALRRRRAS
jgi:hypothetical protein